MIIDEFGKDYGIYFSILSLISSSKTARGEIEIDIVAVNEMEKRLCFYEVKRNKKRINISALENKASEIVKKFPDYNVEYLGLSMEDL